MFGFRIPLFSNPAWLQFGICRSGRKKCSRSKCCRRIIACLLGGRMFFSPNSFHIRSMQSIVRENDRLCKKCRGHQLGSDYCKRYTLNRIYPRNKTDSIPRNRELDTFLRQIVFCHTFYSISSFLFKLDIEVMGVWRNFCGVTNTVGQILSHTVRKLIFRGFLEIFCDYFPGF